MEKIKSPIVHKILKILKWAFLVLLGLYIIAVIWRVIDLNNTEKTNRQVEKIHSTKLSMDDVMGVNLPPDPGAEADKTVQGIDVNENGIRDDVEIAIFKEYPNSTKTRAVLLQYALALQMETIQPFVNTVNATEIVREQSRGYQCVGELFPNNEAPESFENLSLLIKFVKDKQFDTQNRKEARNIFVENVRSFSDLDQVCDIDVSILSN